MPPLKRDRPAQEKKMIRKEVKSQLNKVIEKKYHDFDKTIPGIVLLGGTNHFISQIPDGTLVTERVGQKIRATRVQIRGLLTQGSAQTGPETVRVVLYRNNIQGNQMETIIPDVLESGNSPSFQQLNWDNQGSIQVLYDRRFIVSPGTELESRLFFIDISKTMIMKYDGAGSGSNGKGRLTLSMVSDSSDTTQNPFVQFTSRLWFTDA